MGAVVELRVPFTLSIASIGRFKAQLDEACNSAATAGIVLKGDADVFCNGLDFGEIVNPDLPPTALTSALVELLATVRFAPRPSVAWVRGTAAGGGVGLAAACDLVLAEPDAAFSLPELLFGFFPAIVLPVLAERMLPQRLRLRALEGGAWPASAALADGLVDELVDADALPAVLARHVRAMVRPLPATVGRWKEYTARTQIADLRLALEAAARVTADALAEPGIRQRITAFDQEGLAPWVQST